MAYARCGWEGSDVYVYRSLEGLIPCGCFLTELPPDSALGDEVGPLTHREMLDHLAVHQAAGQEARIAVYVSGRRWPTGRPCGERRHEFPPLPRPLRNVGVSDLPHSLHAFLWVEIWVSWFVGLIFFLSAWLRRPSHFKRIGRSKLAWMAITTLGLIPFVGIIPALIYFWRVYLHLPAKHPEDQTRGRPKPVPRASSRPATVLVECPICRGRRGYPCRVYGGRVSMYGPSVEHCSCSGGWVSCERCNATGTVRVSSPCR